MSAAPPALTLLNLYWWPFALTCCPPGQTPRPLSCHGGSRWRGSEAAGPLCPTAVLTRGYVLPCCSGHTINAASLLHRPPEGARLHISVVIRSCCLETVCSPHICLQILVCFLPSFPGSSLPSPTGKRCLLVCPDVIFHAFLSAFFLFLPAIWGLMTTFHLELPDKMSEMYVSGLCYTCYLLRRPNLKHMLEPGELYL